MTQQASPAGVPMWVRALIAALLLALLVPAVAAAQTAVEDPPVAEQTPAATDPAATDPAATDPAATDPATPAADGQTTPVVTDPAPPPAATTTTPPASTAPTAPVQGDSGATPPASTAPTAPATTPSTGPTLPVLPSTILEELKPVLDAANLNLTSPGGLPTTPDAPEAPKVPKSADPPVGVASPPTATRIESRPDAVGPAGLGVSPASLGGPTAPTSAIAERAATREAPSVGGLPPDSTSFVPMTGLERPERMLETPSPVVVPPSRVGPLDGGGLVSGADEVFSPSMAPVPGSRVPGSGASLLSVLAGYVLPGGGTMPGATLFVFVQLAVLLLVGLAGPGGRGMVIRGVGGVGAAAGHAMAVRRPG